MAVYRLEVSAKVGSDSGSALPRALAGAGFAGIRRARASQLFFVEGELAPTEVQKLSTGLFADPVSEAIVVSTAADTLPPPRGIGIEVHLRPGVMDPVAESALAELRQRGLNVTQVRTARRYEFETDLPERAVAQAVGRLLANDCIEEVVIGTAGVRPAPRPPTADNRLRHVAIRELDNAELEQLSRRGHLFLSPAEMRTIQEHFRDAGRDPTDLELETLAQTWSEHCVHKTLKSAVKYRGAPLPTNAARGDEYAEAAFSNLLRDTIARATAELMRAGRGPRCLSVFKDNAGVVEFDDQFGVAFKVETHNRPSAIEPYGGAATGVGGCIRDVIGCGLGAKPIADTDVFCVAPPSVAHGDLPKGVIHPQRVLEGVVRGVADYGNRMGIPTVNGAVHFDPRYLGNPLVYCGCVGLIPCDKIEKAARAGDRIVLVGGRTGRDGIHGATFSSAELTGSHAEEFSHAVQIGNAITEKRVLDAIMQARDADGGCLYSALTDCGAGGLSSAVGEMAAQLGATVNLELVPLKYAGLRYDEVWISEAQERMVLAVPAEKLDRLMAIMQAEEVEATVIGTFGHRDTERRESPSLVVRYEGRTVGELDMRFLHDGVPQLTRQAEWRPALALEPPRRYESAAALMAQLRRQLAHPTIAGKAWIIRRYDHEVQGASVVKPLAGPRLGPSDAAVIRPRIESTRGVAIGCGLCPQLSEIDPYWMAAAAIDEAIRNVVCVGGDPAQTALLDNFCWGRCDDPRQMGALVRACQACYDAAIVYGTPFISGKDSLNNVFALTDDDVERAIELLRRAANDERDLEGGFVFTPETEIRTRETRRLSIPPTLLISAISLVHDIGNCVTSDLKRAGDAIYLVGGQPPIGFDPSEAARVHACVARLIQRRLARASKDVSDGGWLTALAEMAIGSTLGLCIDKQAAFSNPFGLRVGAYLLEGSNELGDELSASGVRYECVGRINPRPRFEIGTEAVDLRTLRDDWNGTAHH
ncbi:MAG: phosphoribosylformylglycinamidine synthase subunit PurS [Phycisphaerae bacterium]